MALPFIGTFYSILTGLSLAAFYMLNKKVAPAGKPLLVIMWVFAFHIPATVLWALQGAPLHVTPGYFFPGMMVLILSTTADILTIRGLSLSPFSLTMPILGLSPVFTALISIPLLHEWPSALQWGGILMAVAGILCLYAPPERPWAIFSFGPRFIRERGAPFIAAAALIWAASSSFDRLALRQADPQFHALFVLAGLVGALFAWLLMRGDFQAQTISRSWMRLLFLTGSVGAISYALQLLALQHTPAGPFEAIKRVMSQLLALLLGYLLFQEPVTRPKVIGIVILSIGVPLIVL